MIKIRSVENWILTTISDLATLHFSDFNYQFPSGSDENNNLSGVDQEGMAGDELETVSMDSSFKETWYEEKQK